MMLRPFPALLLTLLVVVAATLPTGRSESGGTEDEPEVEDSSGSSEDPETSEEPEPESADAEEAEDTSSGSEDVPDDEPANESADAEDDVADDGSEGSDETDGSDDVEANESDDPLDEVEEDDASDGDGSSGPDGVDEPGEHEGSSGSGESDEGADEGGDTSDEGSSDPPEDDADGGDEGVEEVDDEAGGEDVDEPDEDDRSDEDDAEFEPFEDTDDGFRTTVVPHKPTVAYDAADAVVRVESQAIAAPLESRFDALLEFLDGNGNGAYDLGERVLQRFALAELETVVEPMHDGRVVRHALPANGSVELRFHSRADGATKLDVAVLGFPFTDPASRLAFGSSASVSGGLRASTVDGHPAVVGAIGGTVAYLSWAPEVEVDGKVERVGWSVHTSTSEDAESAILYWSYPQGAQVVHDPTLGVTQVLRETLGERAPFFAGAAAAVALLALGYGLRRRSGP